MTTPDTRTAYEELFASGEPGIVDVRSLRPTFVPSTAMVVWDEAFAVEQLERLMRVPETFRTPFSRTTNINPCGEIPLPF